jgi:hypothetical protein
MRPDLESALPSSAQNRTRVTRRPSAYAKPPVAVRVTRLCSDLFHRDGKSEAALTKHASHMTHGVIKEYDRDFLKL